MTGCKPLQLAVITGFEAPTGFCPQLGLKPIQNADKKQEVLLGQVVFFEEIQELHGRGKLRTN